MQICTLTQTHNHISIPPLSFLQAGCPFCCQTNSVKALKVHQELNKVKIFKTFRNKSSTKSAFSVFFIQGTRYAGQHIWCLSQARINCEGCARNGIQRKNDGDGRGGGIN